ncbi:MAG: hypothetical protein IPP14_06170 [Planctomycetes bacterium]|nr:hypothetical protein [Planctomycetota bacterium]
MTTPTEAEKPLTEPEDTPVHWLQRFMDNPWLLLMLGFFVPFFSYTVWGWVELLLVKKAELP